MQTMSLLLALLAKSLAGVIYIFVLPSLRARHDETIQVPSRDRNRSIKVHVYRSPNKSSKSSPVLINFHGSGFLVPLHGSDGEFCYKISRKTKYTVLDVQYRLTPEHPFPAALNDADDVVYWVQQQQRSGTQFTDGRVALSGFSAGGNLALGAPPRFPRNTFSAIIAFYPWLDLVGNPWFKVAPNIFSVSLPAWMIDLCQKCYVPKGGDARDPRISPVFAEVEKFPDRMLVVTASCDTLAKEGEEMVKRINKAPGRRRWAEHVQMGWFCGHGWDKFCLWGTLWWWEKEKSYNQAVAMLSY